MTKWMGMERWVSREMIMGLRFVVWEPKWMRENQVEKNISDDKEKYLHILRLWSGQRSKGSKKLEWDKKGISFSAGITLLKDSANRCLAPLPYNNGFAEERVSLKPETTALVPDFFHELLLHYCSCTAIDLLPDPE